MSVPQISLRAADIVTGEAPEVPEADTSTLFTNLKLKFPEDARFLASHVGFDDNDLEWEGVRPLGKGAFGKVGLWAAKDTQGSYVKVGDHESIVARQLTDPGNRCETMRTERKQKRRFSRSAHYEPTEPIPVSQYSAT